MEDQKQPSSPDDHQVPWIERIVRLAATLGMNPVRVRWKLIRLENAWQQRRQRARNRLEHVRYQHKTCPRCTAINDRDERVCSHCQTRLTSRTRQVLARVGLRAPEAVSVSALLGVAMVLIYGRMLLDPGGQSLWGFDIPTLVRYGGNVPSDIPEAEWWRPFTSVFLHVGLWHIGFNLLALATVGPLVEELYGRWQMLFFFMVTGFVAALGSRIIGLDGVGIGASGALMGLIGVAASWGHRRGTQYGHSIRNSMLQWAAYVVIFGFFLRADNRAHLVGLAAGALLGLVLEPAWLRSERGRPFAITMAIAGILCALATFYAVMVPISQSWTQILGQG